MKHHSTSTSNNIFMKINHFIEETDIRILVFVPPIIGFAGLVIGAFIMNLLTQGQPYRPLTDFMLGVLSFFLCFSGYAEMRKKEMPGLFGGIYKGNLAIISGLFIIILSVFMGTVALAHSLSSLLH
jgi:hypothetical protein